MSSSNQTKKPSNENSKDISYTQKCIILASIVSDKKKTLINLYDNIPIVKLYTANLKDENFVYSKVKGPLFFLYEEENKKINYYLQIYDPKSLSLAFNLQINQKMIKDFIELENNFICLPTKYNFLGFTLSLFFNNLIFISTIIKYKKFMVIRVKSLILQSKLQKIWHLR